MELVILITIKKNTTNIKYYIYKIEEKILSVKE